jgi:hypothetical protein
MSMLLLQQRLKVPKGQWNDFGGYHYRSCEDIVEAAKPLLAEYGYYLIISDDVVSVGDRIYVMATASIMSDDKVVASAKGFAREPLAKKGMDESQLTGTASSYARKYALNGLFGIDDTKDADSQGPGDEERAAKKRDEPAKAAPKPTAGDKPWYNDLKADKPAMILAVRAKEFTPKQILENLRQNFAVNKAVAAEILAIK